LAAAAQQPQILDAFDRASDEDIRPAFLLHFRTPSAASRARTMWPDHVGLSRCRSRESGNP
jgi:hypothetical protein